MRIIAPRTRLRSCAIAVLAAVSCTQDENEEQPSLTGPPALAAAAVSAYDIVKVGSMTIDGNLSDWANVAAISMTDNSGRPGGVDNTARVKLAWNDTYLYAAYDVSDTEVLAVQTARDHGEIYRDDEIELYLDPQGDGDTATSMTPTDYQLLANVREALGDSRGTGTPSKDESYNAASFLAKAATNGTLNAGGTDVGYSVELRISWSDLGVTPGAGHFMRIDPAVGDRDGSGAPPVQAFDWAGLTGTYNNPSGWKDVQLVNPPPPESAYDIVKVGGTGMTVDGNLSDWAGVAAISMSDDPARGAAANNASVKLAWNDTYLYAAYNLTDTELLALQTARDHGDIYKDDEVELYIDPQGDGAAATSMSATDYQFFANVREAVGDKKGDGAGGKDASYNAASFLAKAATNGTLNATGTDVGYTVELRVSWSDLGVTPAAGHFMRIDPAVGDRDGSGPPPVHDFDWAGITGTYNNPSAWKDVQLVVDNTAPSAPTNLALNVVSANQIDVSWTASTSTDAARYNIYRGTTGTPALLTSVDGGPYQDTALTASTSYTYQVAAVDAAGNESPRTAPDSATTTGAQASGIPYGPYHLFASTSSTQPEGVEHFNLDHSFASSGNLVARINAARQKGIKLVITIPGSSHTPWKDSTGKFSMELWKEGVRTFDTPANRQAVDSAVADGTIVGNSVMDEPNSSDWGMTMTKPMMDEMCGYVKDRFPTLPTGVVVVHWWREGHGQHPSQVPAEKYAVCDFIIDQYDWWQPPNGPGTGVGEGNITGWKAAALVAAERNGISIAFSMNLINGGTQDSGPEPRCPWSQPGSGSPRCWMSPDQVRDWGKLLGEAGCWVLMWEYRNSFMTKPANANAFQEVKADLDDRTPHACRRTD